MRSRWRGNVNITFYRTVHTPFDTRLHYLPSRRTLNGTGFGVCVVVLSIAYYLQYVEGLQPCPLCVLQRTILAILGIVFLGAAVHDPRERAARYYGLSVVILAGLGAGLAGYQVWLQSLPPETAVLCLPPVDYLLRHFPLRDVLDVILQNPVSCAEVQRTLLGLSIPGWCLLTFLGLGVSGGLCNGLSR
jgi:disulfide bond formation protein DsbB